MHEPKFPLGVDLMDVDHAHLEDLLAEAIGLADDRLAAHLSTCRTEIAAHFSREEGLMKAHAVPVLACHVAQHSRMIEEIDAVLALEAGNTDRLRAYLTRYLPNQLMAHIASVDQISARFLTGDLPQEMVAHLRLPEVVAS